MKEKTTKLVSSVMVLVLCLSMFLGTTLAWFNDAEGSGNNQITAGNLDVTLEYLAGDTWVAVDETTNVFRADALWEPGHTEVVYLRTGNAGTLALQYQLGIRVAAETASVNADGERLVLSDHIQYAILEGVDSPFATREDALAAVTAAQPLSSGYTREGVLVAGMAPEYLAMVVFMPETVGNEANYATGAVAPTISLGISLQAVQMSGEADGFGDSYDSGVQLPGATLDSTITEPVLDKAENGVIVEKITVGDESDAAYAQIPQGVTLADGAQVLTLSVQEKAEPEASITVQENESVTALDIHVEGLAADNTVPMLVTLKNLLPTGLNTTSVTMYHVEDGQTVAMTYAANPVNHNEFSYDAATGTVVLCVASFSEYVAVTKNLNLWEGGFDYTWYVGKSSPYTIATADQLAGFGAIVDGTAEGVAQDSFDGKTVQLGADIDLSGGVSLNPIGCGYVSGVSNSGGVEGRAFKGTFDGQNHTISNLYQNGWDIGLEYCNLGGGLFASIANGTVKNLTITGADIRMECVELGILVGLSQGECTYDNITIMNSKIANYQRATGGLIGEVSALNGGEEVTTISNVHIASNVTVGSMWGDFDAPCGGVIGARWDDANGTKIEMSNCVVAPRMDVYNDVTSSYQWYAYRRAGMLIGNTEQVAEDGRTAAAPFLECTDVTVYYGPWVNYHYCEFNNHNPNWPWVRVEAGNYCNAFSNPRYGVPNDPDTGKPVTGFPHSHSGDDTCNELLVFNQLYGGGQGVYGAVGHDYVDVKTYAYAIQYINAQQLIAETFVADNSKDFTVANEKAQKAAEDWVKEQGYGEVVFGGFVNAGSTKVTVVPAGNPDNIILYPYFNKPYTARFVDQNGNVLAWCLFHSEKTDVIKIIEDTRALAESQLVFEEDFSFDKWEVHFTDDNGATIDTADYNANNIKNYTTDVTIYPVYKYNGDVSLIPMDTNGDGSIDYYQVAGYGAKTGEQELVEIPGYVLGVPVTTINADAFSSYDDLHSVRIPGTIEEINSQSFTANQGSSWNPKRDTVTLYYEGDPAVWQAAMEKSNKKDYSGMLKNSWDNNMGDGSRVFFLVDGKVDNTHYWELNEDFEWVHHEHAYTYEAAKTCAHGEKSHYEYGGGFIGIGASLQKDEFTNYGGTCDCNSCDGKTRPDAAYWTTE